MKRLSLLALLLVLPALGCGHSPSPVSSLSSPVPSFQLQLVRLASDTEQIPLESLALSATSGNGSIDNQENLSALREEVGEKTVPVADSLEFSKSSAEEPAKDGTENAEHRENLADEEEAGEEKEATIADPLEPFNRAMFHFNDKMYFWVLKPVAKGYNFVVPERGRVSVKNFFFNLRFPIRFVSCLLRADFSCAGTELGRFTVNTVWGLGGLLDPASSKQLDISKREADLGQTLGVYGLGQGFYFVWPVLGPSSLRDSIGLGGEYFLYPLSYMNPWYAELSVRAYEELNKVSLRIGDYESLKEAAIDPYVALRDAYAQYRQKMIEGARGIMAPPKPGGVR